jgi:hypothetical protein
MSCRSALWRIDAVQRRLLEPRFRGLWTALLGRQLSRAGVFGRAAQRTREVMLTELRATFALD